jgi:hypothetical protein
MTKLLCTTLLLLAGAAMAQTSAPPPKPNDSMEPGVNTSSPAPQPTPASTPAATPATGVKPVATNKAAAAGAAQGKAQPNAPVNAKGNAKGNAKDRLDLESSQITGNRELPKVLYIVPWRGAELGDLVGRPVNSLLDEVLEPIDRDVFRRQNRYFEALQPNEATPASKPEK